MKAKKEPKYLRVGSTGMIILRTTAERLDREANHPPYLPPKRVRTGIRPNSRSKRKGKRTGQLVGPAATPTGRGVSKKRLARSKRNLQQRLDRVAQERKVQALAKIKGWFYR